MSDSTRDPAADADAVWTAAARHLAGEGTADQRADFERAVDAAPGRAELLRGLQDALSPLARDARPDVDVEAALAAVLARRDEPSALVGEPTPQSSVPPARRLTVESNPQPHRKMAPPPSAVRRSGWSAAPWLRAAAAVVLLLSAALVWRMIAAGGTSHPERYATAIGARQTVRLPDGSTVQLGPGSHLEVAPGYGRPQRAVRLEGEAYFDVRHNDAHPFVVRTAGAVVRDLGTTFSVRTADSSGVRVVVTSGSVAVQPAADGAGEVLRAGDRGSVARGGAVRVERGTATDDDVAWTRGRLVFRDAPVPEVAAELRRWYGITLVVRDPELAGRHLTASFGSETADEAVRVVAAALGGQLQRRGDTAAVVPAGELR
jgi:transmembrane sensor